MILFFDVETNGFIKNMEAPLSDLNNFPRITQLAYSIYENNGDCIMRNSSLIYPDGWTIPKEKFFIDNGHSTERCMKEGKQIQDVLETLILDSRDVYLMVAYNLAFDAKVLAVEMIRLGLKMDKKIKMCAMLKATEILKLKNVDFRRKEKYKWPKLQESYKFFNGHNYEGNHDALADVDATSNIFFHMVRRGDILI